MRAVFCQTVLLATYFGSVNFSPIYADQVRASLESLRNPTNVFGDSEVEFQFVVQGINNSRARLTWALALQSGGTLLRGEVSVENEKEATVLRLAIPPVKEGVILPLSLAVSLFTNDGQNPIATHKQPLWVFNKQPFATQTQWLKDQKIALYDPAEKTAAALAGLLVPCEEIRNLASLGELSPGIIIIGQGVSFRTDRDLPSLLWAAAARGIPVLCLAPADGDFALPGDTANPAPNSISFKRHEAITAFDSRLDSGLWQQISVRPTTGLALKAEANEVLLEVSPEARAWPWVEICFENQRGRLIFCSFELLERWETSPTPRFLLARILGELGRQPYKHGLGERTTFQ